VARRRSNGEGTIYYRKDGRWEGAVYLLTTSGARKRVRVYGVSRQEVHTKLTEAQAKQQQGIATPDKVWRLGDYLDYWLEHVIKPSRRPLTYDRYKTNVRLHLKPDLGHLPLTRLTTPLVQAYLNDRLATGKTHRHAQMLREVLSSALTGAMRQELVGRNVARLVQLPGRASSIGSPWTLSEARHFLTATRGHWLYPAFVLLLTCGMRRGEVLGLRWVDVDFARGRLHLEQQVYRAGGVVQEGPLKTASSRRTLPLIGRAREVLLAHRAATMEGRSHLVFTAQKSDGPMEPQTFTSSFQDACRKAGLRVVRAHDMRHTTATLLKNLGVPVRDVQLILGHANVVTTQQIYQHDDLDSRRGALGQLDKQFSHDGNADTDGVPALPSKWPSRQGSLSSRSRGVTPVWLRNLYDFLGWDGGIRTPECWYQKPVPYHLATSH
jgi:integrase